MMAGLLGDFEDPRQQGLLALGLGLLNSRGSFGQGLGQAGMQAMDVMRQATMDKQRKAQMEQAQQMQAVQLQAAQQQMVEHQRAAAERERASQFLQTMPSPQMQASMGALAGGGGPTAANAARIPAVDPTQQLMFNAVKSGALPLSTYLASMQKDETPMILPEGATAITRTGRTLATGKPKAVSVPSAIQEYEYAKNQGFAGTLNDFLLQQKKAGASSVSVNTGQRGLDNTLKLRGDFRSEPVYKAHQEMQSAYAQIQQSLKQASPAGDLAGATKIMKLLDPGSVVRESELGMAMAASGLMDRATNYASMVMSGQKLTPTQRQDFLKLANALYGESIKQYNNKRTEYEGIAKRNMLNVDDVLGQASAAPAGGVVDFGSLK